MTETGHDTAFTLYPYARVAAQDESAPRRHPVVVVGAGPVGLALALDLGRRGTPVLVLDESDGAGTGSRAICFARRTLDIAERLGCGRPMVDKGVVWNVGRVYHGEREVFSFDLSPDAGVRNPAFVNLQQPYVERFLVERIREVADGGAPIEIRGRNRVIGLDPAARHASLDVETPEGPYRLEAERLVACDGARSPIRGLLGLGFEGRVFEDNFLIADIRTRAPFPSERRFWFEPPFPHAGRSALLHKQPDDLWRLDFQLGWDIDREAELAPERVRERVAGMLGEGLDYTLEWTSIYTFQCRRMRRFRHGPVLFAGDAAHQVSPFGARGANSGVQDAENLAWKLDLVARGLAPDSLLDSYSDERVHAADENILASTRSTDFLTPKSAVSETFRDAVLALAGEHPFARPLINSGRLSVPCVYDALPLNGPDALAGGPARTRVGSACCDAPLGGGFLLERLGGERFTLLAIDTDAPERVDEDGVRATRLAISTRDDPSGALAERYLGEAASALYLIRPDQHVAARWARFDEGAVRAALRRATGRETRGDAARADGDNTALGGDRRGGAGRRRAASGRPPAAAGSGGTVARGVRSDVGQVGDDRAEDVANADIAATLRLAPNLADGDGFYDDLLRAHEELDRAASEALNARLVLVLCNHVGERSVIDEALRVARAPTRSKPRADADETVGGETSTVTSPDLDEEHPR